MNKGFAGKSEEASSSDPAASASITNPRGPGVEPPLQPTVEESLRQTEERYRQLVEQAPDEIVVHRDGKMLLVNSALVKLWGGVSHKDFIGRPILDFNQPRHREIVRRRVRETMEGTAVRRIDQLQVRLDGRVVRVEVIAVPCLYEGRPAVQTVLHDVTERRRSERQLRKQREILKKFFHRIPVLVAFIGRDRRIKIVNREWKRVLGWSKELPLDEFLAQIFPDPVARQRAIDRTRSGEKGWRDYRIRARDGRMLDISWTSILLFDGTRIGIGQDVTLESKPRRRCDAARQSWNNASHREPRSFRERTGNSKSR